MKRLVIERLDLDLRGVPRATAELAARQIGPALARALTGRRLTSVSAASVDAGAVAIGAAPEAAAVATQIAARIAGTTSGSRS
jgi:hypothetical protein